MTGSLSAAWREYGISYCCKSYILCAVCISVYATAFMHQSLCTDIHNRHIEKEK